MSPARRPPPGGDGPPSSPGDDSNVEFGPRKLIRSSLADVRREHGLLRNPLARKHVPPEQTNAEAFYYMKQMQSRSPIVVRLLDGEELRGWIEWYDKDVLKLNRENGPNLLIAKHAIKYLYKEDGERPPRKRRVKPESEEGGPADLQPDKPTR